MKRWFGLMLLLVGCHTGNLGEKCNGDGTCNAPALACNSWKECEVRTVPVRYRCSFESECFCLTCAERCGDAGVRQCLYSDTSVWGSKPAVCECK